MTRTEKRRARLAAGRMTEIWMNLQYQIEKVKDRIEAAAELHWYAGNGYYKIDAVGFGQTEEEAKKVAGLMLGQARAALHVALIDSSRCVPETPTENAHERSNRPQHAD